MRDATQKTAEFMEACKEMTLEEFPNATMQDGIMMLIVQLAGRVFELEAELRELKDAEQERHYRHLEE